MGSSGTTSTAATGREHVERGTQPRGEVEVGEPGSAGGGPRLDDEHDLLDARRPDADRRGPAHAVDGLGPTLEAAPG